MLPSIIIFKLMQLYFISYNVTLEKSSCKRDLKMCVCAQSRGETALHKAAASCQRTICAYLVDAGASLTKTDLQVSGLASTPPLPPLVHLVSSLTLCCPQGDNAKAHAERAQDWQLAEYLENQQQYQLIPRDDHETSV